MNYEANGFSSSVLNTVLFLNCLLWAKDGSVVLPFHSTFITLTLLSLVRSFAPDQ